MTDTGCNPYSGCMSSDPNMEVNKVKKVIKHLDLYVFHQKCECI